MELNGFEGKFFDQILKAELCVPVHATLEYEDETFEIILVPELTEEGEFTLKYYNAPAYDPEPQCNESGIGTKTWSIDSAFGLHPTLVRAWLNNFPVTVQMHPSPLPFKPGQPPKLGAMVRYAEGRNRGALSLDRNQVTVQGSPLKKVEFCIVEFPEFMSPSRRRDSVAGIGTPEREVLQSIASRLEDNATINIKPSAHHIVLDSGNGWKIRLTRDEKPTRGLIGHTGLIERSEGGEYGTDELGDLLNGLKYFFAFVAGAYCHPTVVIGYDSQNRPVWGQIGRFAAARHRLPNWFNNGSVRMGHALEELFPSFWNRWIDHKDAMVAVIECYVHSNAMRKAGVPNDAVAKSYAGLEILASLTLKKTIDGSTSKEIHQVLCKQQIPHFLLTQDKTPTMARLSKDLGESEMRGAHLLGGVRNYVAHPLDRDLPAEVKEKYLKYLDADPVNYPYLHDLSQFYLEYALLNFFGYETSGSYRQLLETMQQV